MQSESRQCHCVQLGNFIICYVPALKTVIGIGYMLIVLLALS